MRVSCLETMRANPSNAATVLIKEKDDSEKNKGKKRENKLNKSLQCCSDQKIGGKKTKCKRN